MRQCGAYLAVTDLQLCSHVSFCVRLLHVLYLIPICECSSAFMYSKMYTITVQSNHHSVFFFSFAVVSRSSSCII